jgi:hypothetical protein
MRLARENKDALAKLQQTVPEDFDEWLAEHIEAQIAANEERQARAREAVEATREAWQEAKRAQRGTMAFNERGVGQIGPETIEAGRATRAAYRRHARAKKEVLNAQQEERDLRLRLKRARRGLPEAAKVLCEATDRFGNPYAVDNEAARRADTVIRAAQREDLAGGRLGHAVNVHLRRNARRRQAAEAGEDE